MKIKSIRKTILALGIGAITVGAAIPVFTYYIDKKQSFRQTHKELGALLENNVFEWENLQKLYNQLENGIVGKLDDASVKEIQDEYAALYKPTSTLDEDKIACSDWIFATSAKNQIDVISWETIELFSDVLKQEAVNADGLSAEEKEEVSSTIDAKWNKAVYQAKNANVTAKYFSENIGYFINFDGDPRELNLYCITSDFRAHINENVRISAKGFEYLDKASRYEGSDESYNLFYLHGNQYDTDSEGYRRVSTFNSRDTLNPFEIKTQDGWKELNIDTDASFEGVKTEIYIKFNTNDFVVSADRDLTEWTNTFQIKFKFTSTVYNKYSLEHKLEFTGDIPLEEKVQSLKANAKKWDVTFFSNESNYIIQENDVDGSNDTNVIKKLLHLSAFEQEHKVGSYLDDELTDKLQLSVFLKPGTLVHEAYLIEHPKASVITPVKVKLSYANELLSKYYNMLGSKDLKYAFEVVNITTKESKANPYATLKPVLIETNTEEEISNYTMFGDGGDTTKLSLFWSDEELNAILLAEEFIEANSVKLFSFLNYLSDNNLEKNPLEQSTRSDATNDIGTEIYDHINTFSNWTLGHASLEVTMTGLWLAKAAFDTFLTISLASTGVGAIASLKFAANVAIDLVGAGLAAYEAVEGFKEVEKLDSFNKELRKFQKNSKSKADKTKLLKQVSDDVNAFEDASGSEEILATQEVLDTDTAVFLDIYQASLPEFVNGLKELTDSDGENCEELIDSLNEVIVISAVFAGTLAAMLAFNVVACLQASVVGPIAATVIKTIDTTAETIRLTQIHVQTYSNVLKGIAGRETLPIGETSVSFTGTKVNDIRKVMIDGTKEIKTSVAKMTAKISRLDEIQRLCKLSSVFGIVLTIVDLGQSIAWMIIKQGFIEDLNQLLSFEE